MKKILAVLWCVLIMLAPAMAGGTKDSGGSAAPAAKKTTIQFWNSFTGSDGDVLRKIVNGYNSKNADGITVEMDIMPAATLNEKLAASMATNTAPAVAYINASDIKRYVDAGRLLPLDDFWSVTGANKDDFEPAIVAALQYNGKQYVIPYQWFTTFVYWNKDLFKAAGLDPEKPPATWEEVGQMAAKINNPSKKVAGYGLPIAGAPNVFVSQFWANGGQIYDKATKKSLLNSPENLATLKWMKDLADKGIATKGLTGADIDNLLFAGQVGIYCNGPWLVTGLRENKVNFGVAPMPKGTSGKAYGVAETIGWAVPTGTKDDQKAAAYKFIKYLSADVGPAKEYILGTAFPPYLKSVENDPQVKADPVIKVFSTMGQFAQPFGLELSVTGSINGDVLFPMIEDVCAGADPAAALKKASDQIDELLAKDR